MDLITIGSLPYDYMTTKDKTYSERLKCFHSGFCYVCGSPATLTKTKRGYHGHCSNPECDCQQNFTSKPDISRVMGV